jgi:CheY-like chemotaxis protein
VPEFIWLLTGSLVTLAVMLFVLRLRRPRPSAAEQDQANEQQAKEPPPEVRNIMLADNRNLETLACALGQDLASLASSVEGNAQLLCEGSSRGQTGKVIHHAERLWESVRRVRFFSEKLQAFAHAEEVTLSPTRVTPVLRALIHEIEDYAGGSLEVALNTAPSLPMALVDADTLRSALLFLVETVLSLEPSTPGLNIDAQTELSEDKDGEVLIEIQAESEDQAEESDSDAADIRFSYVAARNLLESQGAWVSLTHRPGLSVVASVALKATTSTDAPAAATAAAPDVAAATAAEAAETAAAEAAEATAAASETAVAGVAAATTPVGTPGEVLSHQFGGILVLDRNPGIREMLTAELRRLGRHVIACDEGKAAQSLYSATPERFELLILEQDARRLSGEALAAQALAARPDVRVILLTSGSRRRGTGPTLAPDGRCVRIPKPFGLMELRGVIGELLGPGPETAPVAGEASGKDLT